MTSVLARISQFVITNIVDAKNIIPGFEETALHSQSLPPHIAEQIENTENMRIVSRARLAEQHQDVVEAKNPNPVPIHEEAFAREDSSISYFN